MCQGCSYGCESLFLRLYSSFAWYSLYVCVSVCACFFFFSEGLSLRRCEVVCPKVGYPLGMYFCEQVSSKGILVTVHGMG